MAMHACERANEGPSLTGCGIAQEVTNKNVDKSVLGFVDWANESQL